MSIQLQTNSYKLLDNKPHTWHNIMTWCQVTWNFIFLLFVECMDTTCLFMLATFKN